MRMCMIGGIFGELRKWAFQKVLRADVTMRGVNRTWKSNVPNS
jgi:hypothetical protein